MDIIASYEATVTNLRMELQHLSDWRHFDREGHDITEKLLKPFEAEIAEYERCIAALKRRRAINA
jgi:hypothetical protein